MYSGGGDGGLLSVVRRLNMRIYSDRPTDRPLLQLSDDNAPLAAFIFIYSSATTRDACKSRHFTGTRARAITLRPFLSRLAEALFYTP